MAGEREMIAARAAERLEASAAKGLPSALVGFDGFNDAIMDVVDRRRDMTPGGYERIRTIAEFAARVGASAGKSANIEIVLKELRFGGNGPLMAGALGRLGAPVTFIGAVGEEKDPRRLHPLYAELVARAGLPLDPYFSAAKLRWILDHVEEANILRREGRLRLGTSDAFFLDRLAGVFATDVTTASRTSLMNLATLQWDPVLAELFGVPIECLPEIRPTTGDFGAIEGVPVTASMVDQQAALFGHGCRKPGDAKITFGTGAFALAIAGDKPLKDPKTGLLPTIAWKLGAAPVIYAIDGGVYNAASAVNWAKELGLFQDFAEIDAFDGTAIERGLVFVPALSGLGCPYWDRSAAGLWLGMGLETSKRDLVQSVLEGVALRAAQVIEAMNGLQPIAPKLSIDGGLANNGYFRGFLANALGRRLTVPASMELTGQGCALFALIGAGLATIDSLPPEAPPQASVEPKNPLDPALRRKFADAVERSRNWR